MSEKIVTIAKFDDVMAAELAVQSLADYDIKAILGGKNFAGTYAGLGIGMAGVELGVLESDAEKAIEILKSVESVESGDEADDDIDGSDD